MNELEAAVAAWVRAEYQFRFGPGAYQSTEAEWFEAAARRLRRALTGKGDVVRAFEALGGEHKVYPLGRRKTC